MNVLIAAILALAVSSGLAYAQFRQGIFGGLGGLVGEQGDPAELPPDPLPDGDFAGCHMHFTSVRREANGAGWRTDYPWGSRHLLLRFSELTTARVSWAAAGVPHSWLIRLGEDDALFQCRFLIASDVGTIGLSSGEAARLREYLLKGGFLWVDDFWGEAAWLHWSREFAKVLPPSEYPIRDVPMDDPIFQSMFEVKAIPQVPSIRVWRGTGGRTSERGAESAVPHFRGVRDKQGRLIAVMTHNTDVSDSWEREGEDPQFFYQFSPDGYALGINVLLYSLTH